MNKQWQLKRLYASEYAYWCYQLVVGDVHFIDDIFKQLKEDGFIDDNDEWIYKFTAAQAAQKRYAEVGEKDYSSSSSMSDTLSNVGSS